MAAFIKVNDFVGHAGNGVHNLGADALTVALSNTAPSAELDDPIADGNGVLANVTEIAYPNLSSRVLTVTSSAQAGGLYKLVIADLTLTATGGSVGPFQYVYVYNNTPTAPADPLLSVHDRGSALTLADGESVDLDFDDVNGLLDLQ